MSKATLDPAVESPQMEPAEGGDGVESLLGSDSHPIRLSCLLKITKTISYEAREEFIRKSQELFAKRNKTNYEKEWLADYMSQQAELFKTSPVQHQDHSADGSDYSLAHNDLGLEYGPATTARHKPSPQDLDAIKPADLNKLFVRPEVFNGVKPPARQWLDQYEKAAISNGWTDAAKVRYMATFLKDTAYSWLTEIVPMQSPDINDWANLRSLFVRCYLGESDRQSAKRDLDRAIQKENEKAAQFIPRMVQMIRTFDPDRKQDVITDDIRHKLLPEYQEKLIMFELKTIQHLYDACTKIEAGMAASRAAFKQREKISTNNDRQSRSKINKDKSPSRERSTSNSSNQSDKSTKDGPSTKRSTSPANKNKNDACFRCGRNNHWAKECRAKTKLDGSPIEESTDSRSSGDSREKTVRFLKNVNVIAEDESSTTEQTAKLESGNFTVNTIRPGGRNFVCVIAKQDTETLQLSMPGNCGLIKQEICCNGVLFDALIDTGAYTCTVDSTVSQQQGWNSRASDMRLFHALGEPMKCLGYADVNVALTLGNVTRTIHQQFTIVENLCTPMILGVDAIRRFNLVISASNKQPLSFAKLPKEKGVRAMETILPPRSFNLIKAKVNTVSNLIMVIPFGFDNSVHVSHSLCQPLNCEVVVQIINTDFQPVQLLDGMQVASFAPVTEVIPTDTGSCNAVLPIEETGDKPETVTIGDNLDATQRQELQAVLMDNIAAFSIRGQLGLSKLYEHHIELLPDSKPFAEPARRHPAVHAEEADRQVKNMLKQGVVEESSSPWASEYVMVKKKTGDWRMCVDYRRLNTLTKKNSYPLPNIEECLEALAGKAYFSKLDFASGYWQMPVAKDSREMTAFRSGGGLYQFRVMPFGLTNAPASFQKMINLMFSGLKGLHLQVFLDDVCLATQTWEEHLKLLDTVLKIVQSNHLKLKGSKCEFGKNEITFLGHKISTLGITQDPDKLRAFSDLPRPTNVSEVRRILGAFGYYRRFVYNFSALAEPIIALTRKDVNFVWGPDQQRAFDQLKQELLKNATLSHYSATDPTMLKTDACKEGIAGMLLQQREGDWKLVSCVSRRLNSAERNYSITELEGLAIVYSVQKLRPYLLGREFDIITDHCALCSLGKKISQNARLRRWSIVLSEYNFRIIYRKGSLHCDVDCLSRAPVCDETDNFLDSILVVNEPIADNLPQPLHPEEWLCEYEDEETQALLDRENSMLRTVNELIYHGNRLYVPQSLRKRMILENHDQGIAAHDGVENTLYRMRCFWWPTLPEDVKEHVQQCERCQLRKPKRTLPHGTMQPHEAFAPMSLVAFDHVGPWHATITNKKFICVGVDTFSRFLFAKAVTDQSAASFAEYLTELIGVFGPPETILTDNSKAFDNALIRTIEVEFGIRHRFSAPHHSQGNAVAERAIESLEEKLSLVGQETGLDWEQSIPLATLSINTRRSATTGFAPYELMFNRDNLVTSRSLSKTANPTLEPEQVENMRADAIASTSDAHSKSRPRFENRRQQTVFELGSKVMSKRSSRRSKLSNRYEGPCEVLERNKDVYKVKKLANNQILIRHASHLEKFVPAGNGAAINILFSSLTFLALVGLASSKFMLPQESPIHWVEDETVFVSEGDEYLTYEIHYGSPCSTLSRHPAYQQLETHKTMPQPVPQPQQSRPNPPQPLSNNHQQANPQNPPSPSPSQQVPSGAQPILLTRQSSGNLMPPITWQQSGRYGSNEQPRPAEEGDDDDDGDAQDDDPPVIANRNEKIRKRNIGSYYQERCDRIYEETIVHSVDRFGRAISRPRRQIIEFVTGFAVCNILTTVKDFFVSRTASRLEERVMTAESRLAALNAQQDLTRLSQQAMAKSNRAQLKLINSIQSQVNQVADLGLICDYLIGEMQQVRAKHDRLYGSIITGSPDLTTIAEILETATFGQLQVRDIEKVFAESPRRGVLRIRVEGPVRSKQTKIYDVIAFPFYTNFSGHSGWKKEYVGSTRLIKNETANCIRGVGASAARRSIDLRCEESNFTDSAVKEAWKSVFVQDLKKENLRPVSSVVWPNMKIQCYTRTLFISDGKRSWNTTCPAYVTSVNLRYSFRTSDNIIHHVGGGIHSSQLHVPKIVTDVLEVHFENFEPVHKELESSMNQTEILLARQEQLHNATVAFTFNNTPVSIHWVTYGCAAILLLFNGYIVLRFIGRTFSCNCVQQVVPSATRLTETASRIVGTSNCSAGVSTQAVEAVNLQNQLNEQGVKLDVLLQAATELETFSISNQQTPFQRTRSQQMQRSRQLQAIPHRHAIEYTVVPTIFNAGL